MQNSHADVAIIGAGASGLAAAWQLSRLGLRSVVFEKSRGLSGRAATRRRGAHRFDHGANFFRLDDPRVDDLVRRQLATDGLAEIPGEVWTHNADGRVAPGDPAHNAVPKWTYRGGINTLGKHLLAASPGTEVVRQTRIVSLGKTDGRWWLEDAEGIRRGGWKHLLLTLPPPQAAALIRAGGLDPSLVSRLESVVYHPQFTLIFGYDTPPISPRPYHALVNPDGRHPLAWLSFEEDKPGHVADGASILVAQMSPHWTEAHYDLPAAELIARGRGILAPLLDRDLPAPDWSDTQRWRYAHPVPGSELGDAPHDFESQGLHFAGDGLVGKGRVALALKTGLEAAERIADLGRTRD